MDLEKAEDQSPTSARSQKARQFQKNIYFCFTDYAKAFDCVDHNKLWKILRFRNTLLPSLKTWIQVKKQQFKPDMEQQACSKLGKEYIKAVYCYLAYLTSMQSSSCEMPGWMNRKLASTLLGEMSTTSDMQIIPL